MIEYNLVRSKRKTVGIYIRACNVEVRAPIKCPKTEIDRFMALKENWIVEKLALSKKQTVLKESFALNYDDMITLRGIKYPITAKTGAYAGFNSEFYLPPGLESMQIKAACIKIYRRLAKDYITERAAVFSKQMGVIPTSIKINSAKTRWGSCSAQKSLNFSWRLIMACDDVIDYVVVHELAHIRQMNHSAKFWMVVEDVLPDYKERKARLKDMQKQLYCEDWG
ncbi:MAG: M48 family metallopeptidase [Defluviitaleaceae bacterium]|nr:M48 family metallopeptidase [Defluviitaleaceae bacterium]